MAFRRLKARLRNLRLRRRGVEPIATGPIHRLDSFDGWAVLREHLTPASVVYSVGIGADVDWDLAMIAEFGVVVHGFDPTPESVAWVREQELPERFVFHPLGLATHDGTLSLYPPKRAGRINFSVEKLEYVTDAHQPVEMPVARLQSLMHDLGHTHVDVLKIDIEGGEFDVIPAILESGVSIGQLLVEIHYHFPSRRLDDAVEMVKELRQHGFQCFYISPRALEFGFVRDRTQISMGGQGATSQGKGSTPGIAATKSASSTRLSMLSGSVTARTNQSRMVSPSTSPSQSCGRGETTWTLSSLTLVR